MKERKIILFIFVFLILINKKCSADDDYNKSKKIKNKSFCGSGKVENNVKYMNVTEKQRIYPRKLSDTFQPIRIYVDISSFYGLCVEMDYCSYKEIFQAKEKATKILSKLIQVKPLGYRISVSKNDIGNDWPAIDSNLTSEEGVEADLVILVRYKNGISSGYEAIAEPKVIDETTKRPIIGTVSIDKSLIGDEDKFNTKYLYVILLHEFTHILGFLYQSFKNFPNFYKVKDFVKNVTRDERSSTFRQYVYSPTVLKKAKEYYGCQEIEGVELEDQDTIFSGSHWEARTLLGEYMNAQIYTEEQVISEFTLALLNDSGWYNVSYYTGGLMRFGKHKGCEFLNLDCEDDGLKYCKNEFADKSEENTPGCTSGRQSRAYITYKLFNDIPTYYNRFHNNYGGIEKADYCLGFSAKDKVQYVGNCKSNISNYGTYLDFGKDNKNNKRSGNNALPLNFGEVFGDNSFCALTSVKPNNLDESFSAFEDLIHPMCYPMICSERSLTIQIYNQYVVCPRSGGKVEVTGNYEGYLFCPDYNLICTGTVLCNDIYDCVEKESLPLQADYDYKIETNQIISELKLAKANTNGYELTLNGTCPQYCKECRENRRCFKCFDNFNLIGVKENDNNPIICDNTTYVYQRFYKSGNVYYPCMEYCLECDNTYCKTCDPIHKLDKNNTICVDKVTNCESYDSLHNCNKCKGEYVFLKEDRTVCHIIDKTKHYSQDGGISYYPCDTNIKNCDECSLSHECTKCKIGSYFIKDDKTKCYNDKNLDEYYTLNNGISYYPCDTNIPQCKVCKNNPNLCQKCNDKFYFLKDNRVQCIDTLKLAEHYTNDSGLSYYPCNEAIDHCKECDNPDTCELCQEEYAFIGKNRTYCTTIPDKSKYYTNDEGKSYYPCNTSFNCCDECQYEYVCTKCIEGYGFFRADKTKCVTIDKKKHYSEDGGISFYLCDDSVDLDNCEECLNKSECSKCKSGYYFLEDKRKKCYNDLNFSQYYTEDGGVSYYPCRSSITHCDTCIEKTSCQSCGDNYYFLGNYRKACFNNITDEYKPKYYTTDDGLSYFACKDSMENCDECKSPNICDKCNENFYLICGQKDKCYGIDIKKFYYSETNESYYPCNTSITNCDECYSKDFCYLCYSSFSIIIGIPYICNQSSVLSNDNKYFKWNSTHYKRCSDAITNCHYCSSESNCTQCEDGYYFLNDNHLLCIHKNDFVPEDEYFLSEDDKNYYSCGNTKGIENCKKCKNSRECTLCVQGYGIIATNTSQCHLKSKLTIGYYSNKDQTIYYPCIDNCDKCINGVECQVCSGRNVLLAENTLCSLCESEIEYMSEELEYKANSLKYEYLFNSTKKVSLARHYVDKDKLQTLTLFKLWECTDAFFKEGFWKINTKELNEKLSQKYNVSKTSFAYVFRTNNHKNYIEIFNTADNDKTIDFKNDCPELEGITIEITNNFTSDIYAKLGRKVCDEVKNKKIDVFEKDGEYFNDICTNFNLDEIDIPLNGRNFIYLGNEKKEIICYDTNCDIKNKEMDSFTGVCNCQINSNIEHLTEVVENKNENFTIESKEVTFTLYKCVKTGIKNLGSNMGFFVGLALIVLQLILYIIFNFSGPKKVEPKKKVVVTQKVQKRPRNAVCKPKPGMLVVQDIDKLIDKFVENPAKDDPKKERQEKDEEEYEIEEEEEVEEDENRSEKTCSKDIRQKPTLNIDTKEELNEKDENISEKFKNTNNLSRISSGKNVKEKNKLNRLVLKENKENQDESEEGSDGINVTDNKGSEKPKKTAISKSREGYDASGEPKQVDSKEQILDFKKQITEDIKKRMDELTFFQYFCILLGLRQPLLSLFPCIEESYIHFSVKLIEMLFIIGLSIFLNELHLSQKYFENKFKYFDDKYNIRFGGKIQIPTGEQFSYALRNTFTAAIISFIICELFQELINYFILGIKRIIHEILKREKVKESVINKEITPIFRSSRKKIMIAFWINWFLMIAFLFYSVNFAAVFSGGSFDFLAPTALTFILLQIFPVILCLIFAIIRTMCLADSEEKMNKFGDLLIY